MMIFYDLLLLDETYQINEAYKHGRARPQTLLHPYQEWAEIDHQESCVNLFRDSKFQTILTAFNVTVLESVVILPWHLLMVLVPEFATIVLFCRFVKHTQQSLDRLFQLHRWV